MISLVEGGDSVDDPNIVFAGCSVPIAAYLPEENTIIARICMERFGEIYLPPGALRIARSKTLGTPLEAKFESDVKAGVWQEAGLKETIEIEVKRYLRRTGQLSQRLLNNSSLQRVITVLYARAYNAKLILSFDTLEKELAEVFGLRSGPKHEDLFI